MAQTCLQLGFSEFDEDRLDLTHLKVCWIDDESTEEIDDGLSIEYLDDNRTSRLWIHIAKMSPFSRSRR